MASLMIGRVALPGEPPIRPVIVDDRVATIPLSELEEEIQCAVCKSIPTSPVTLKVCLHRLCQLCFDRLHATKTRTAGKDRVERLCCPICKAELSSKRVAIPDPDYAALLKALIQHPEGRGTPETLDTDGTEGDDDDDLKALISQAQKLKDVSVRAAAMRSETRDTSGSHRARRSTDDRLQDDIDSKKASKLQYNVSATTSRGTAVNVQPASLAVSGHKRARQPELIDTHSAASAHDELVRATSSDLLQVDVAAMILQHPTEQRVADCVWAIRCVGAMTVEYVQQYIAFRLGEMGVSVYDGDIPRDGSTITLYVGDAADMGSKYTELQDPDATLADLYLNVWQETEIPIMLYFKIGH